MGACGDNRISEEKKQGEGTMPNADVENTEDERCPIERGMDQQQQHDDTATYKIMESSSTNKENQYAEGESDRESDTEMMIDTKRDSTEDLSHKSKEQDPVSIPPSIQDGDRDLEKPGRKRDKPNHTNNDERTGNVDDECAAEINMMTKPQTNSPKRNKKIKMESDQLPPRERTRSKTRLKTPRRP